VTSTELDSGAVMPTPEAAALARLISDISEDYYCAYWMSGCEYGIWKALTQWRATGAATWAGFNVSQKMPALDEAQRTAGGWVWWPEDDGERFIADRDWLAKAGGSAA
jgi:hypothetical protein